jgi:hypothetical protein
MKITRIALLGLAGGIVLVLAISEVAAPAAKHRTLPTGSWGGDHISLNVSASGADLDFDCASGKISVPIELDRSGGFDVPGVFQPAHAGPVLRDEKSAAANARYSGKVDGDNLDLTITRADTKEKIGSFSLSHGARGQVRKCR